MHAKLVRIGNSRGIRIPKPLLEELGFPEAFDLEVREGRLVIVPVGHPRQGWAKAFAAMADRGDDRGLLDGDASGASSWDEEEWEW